MTRKRWASASVAALALLAGAVAARAADPPAEKAAAPADAAAKKPAEATLDDLVTMAATEGLRGRVHGATVYINLGPAWNERAC